ncbi:MAG: signal peptide peptidase SppA [Bacteroidota bacterium]
MGNFFKYLFASALGTILAIFLIFGLLIFFGTVAAVSQMGALGGDSNNVKDGTVLELTLDGAIPELTNNSPASLSTTDFNMPNLLGVYDIRRALEKAKKDDKIPGIYLNIDDVALGLTNLELLRAALEDFKSEGKFIVAYSKYYTQSAYYLASAADRIYLHPLGGVDFRGYGVTGQFYKNMFDKVGVKMEIFYAGKFKGATEPYRLTEFSEANELQYREYINHMFDSYLDTLSIVRNIPVPELRRIANEYLGGDAETALSSGLVDTLAYQDQALDDIRLRLGNELDEKFPVASLKSYVGSGKIKKENRDSDNVVAVLFAEGGISDGETAAGEIGDENYRAAIKKIKENEDVKALVVRVNSPGGSAMASENIWRELELVREAGKPIIISMGRVAASGGYYIATAGDTILAEPTTLTGSIGVFGAFPNASELLNDKIGITFDTIKTGDFSTGMNLGVGLTQAERNFIQSSIEDTYDTFLTRVSDARNMPKEAVHEIAQGRIWPADRALENGLVDIIGTLDDAIALAAEKAAIAEDYRIRDYPSMKNPVEQLLNEFLNPAQTRTKIMQEELGDLYPYYKAAQEVKKIQGIQTRMPFELSVQ